jgi:hypothetical protein
MIYDEYNPLPKVIATAIKSAETVKKIVDDGSLLTVDELAKVIGSFMEGEGIFLDKFDITPALKNLGVRMKGELTAVVKGTVKNPYELVPSLKKVRQLKFKTGCLYLDATTLERIENTVSKVIVDNELDSDNEHKKELVFASAFVSKLTGLPLKEFAPKLARCIDKLDPGDGRPVSFEKVESVRNTQYKRKTYYHLSKEWDFFPYYDYDGDLQNEYERGECIEENRYIYEMYTKSACFFTDPENARAFLSVKTGAPLSDIKDEWIVWAMNENKDRPITISWSESTVSRGDDEETKTRLKELDTNFEIRNRLYIYHGIDKYDPRDEEYLVL